MTLEVAGAIAIASIIWNFYNLIKIYLLEDKICYQKGQIEALIRSQPQIVRCKDCKHGQYEEWDNGECVDKTVYCDGYGIHKPDWFCADGEAKT